MNTRSMNRAYFEARIARLNAIAGTSFDIEMGNAYQCWKVTNESGSHNHVSVETRKELDAAISGMIELAYIMKGV